MTRRDVLTAAAAAAATATGCGPLRARIAPAVHGCPADVTRPHAPPRVVRAMDRTQRSNGSAVDALALVPVTSNRIVFAFPGRGGTAADTARDSAGFADLGAPRSIVVCVGGGESYWHPRANGVDAMGEFFAEVLPWARETYLMEPPYGIVGWSMGGFGALAVAQARPDLFDRVCAVSPALWQTYAQQHAAVPDAFDGENDFERWSAFARAPALRGIDVRIVCGTSDAFYDNASAFARELHGLTSASFTAVDHGCHEEETWHRTMRDDFAFVERRRTRAVH